MKVQGAVGKLEESRIHLRPRSPDCPKECHREGAVETPTEGMVDQHSSLW